MASADEIDVSGDGGVLKQVLEEGSGECPSPGDEVQAHYTGTLLDGTKFDSSRDRGKVFKFTLGRGQVIKAWDMGFASMSKGEKAILTCAPEYAYGSNGSPPKIPPNSTLKFDVELIDFGPKPKEMWEMNEEEKMEEALKAKTRGNEVLKAGDLEAAAFEYQEALRFLDDDSDGSSSAEKAALILSVNLNLALALLKTEDYAGAVKAGTSALAVDADNVKALFRRGCALGKMGELVRAKSDLLAAAKLSPSDKSIRKEYSRVNAALKAAKAKEKKAFSNMFSAV
jgi:peptidylprolyl isomerase